MSKKIIVIDLALKSDIGLLINQKFFAIKPKVTEPLEDDKICEKGFIGSDKTTEEKVQEIGNLIKIEVCKSLINTKDQGKLERVADLNVCPSNMENEGECYIELPLFASDHEGTDLRMRVKLMLENLGFKNIYEINVGQGRNACARKLGFNSDNDFDYQRVSEIDSSGQFNTFSNKLQRSYCLQKKGFSKGLRQSKFLPMIYALENNLFPKPVSPNMIITEDLIDTVCIADVACPQMQYQVVEATKRAETKERRLSYASKVKAVRDKRIKDIRESKDAKIKRLEDIIKHCKTGYKTLGKPIFLSIDDMELKAEFTVLNDYLHEDYHLTLPKRNRKIKLKQGEKHA